jgi:uncharacterized membrane protein
MNQTHLHLLINHLPIIGSILGGLVLAHGIWAKSYQTKIAAYNLLLISSVGAVIAYLTGEAAEETVENIQGISKTMLDQHEDAAVYSLVALITLGILSIGGLFLTIRKSPLSIPAAWVILVVSIVSFGIIARTGYLGGQIRHTEISTAAVVQQGAEQGDDD